jgi:hypothetical protein
MTQLGGDQRFEVTYRDPKTVVRKIFGWCDTMEGAEAMRESIRLHPGMEQPKIRDREKHPDTVPSAPVITGPAPKKRAYDEDE